MPSSNMITYGFYFLHKVLCHIHIAILQEEVDAKGELVGLHKLSSSFYHKMCESYAKIVSEKPKLGYEYQLLWMSQHVCPVFVLNSSCVKWYEIDDEDDLRYAETNIIDSKGCLD